METLSSLPDSASGRTGPYKPYESTEADIWQSNKALGMVIGCESGETEFVTLQVEDHQALKQIEDEIADMLLCLDSTLDTVSTFLEMYDQISSNSQLESIDISSSTPHSFDIIAASLREKTKEVSYTRKKAEALLSKVQNTRTLVCYHWILSILRKVCTYLLKNSIDLIFARKAKWLQYQSADCSTPSTGVARSDGERNHEADRRKKQS
jgi:uncharacterized protein YwgA